MKLKYYAWLRDSLGRESEEIVLPPEIKTVGMLLDWLPSQGERYKRAFEYIDVVLVSVNSHYADRNHPVRDEDEVILAPPIAGG
ncbi:MoaD/ThiS family protein [Aromatoleum buckelii]|uniref:MoaD family protein n=1 Tax=Aromatoleum buckelii TaxID=200254 RepID=A0ABX1N5D2_9RHOO|nr:MoaD/ThiS family protein [Aromatoleum buckelii]MCK0511675.1 MoaD/ThiS family protein [Aromatoleum buckelii]